MSITGFDWNAIALTASTWVLPVLFAITLHEAAHGWVAWRLGDDTARVLGRISINPLRHIDPVGTVLIPAVLLFGSGGRMMFGFAKPVQHNRKVISPGLYADALNSEYPFES